MYQEEPGVSVLATDIPAIEVYPRAAALGWPVHRVEPRRPSGRTAPAALDTIRALACELLPEWRAQFTEVSSKSLAANRRSGAHA